MSDRLSDANQKLTTTDIRFWVWPARKTPAGSSQTLASKNAPPHCNLKMRVFMTNQNGRRYVDLIHIHDIETVDGYLERMPAWADDEVIAKYIDRELRKRFPDAGLVRTQTNVIDKEVSKSRAIQNNHTFIAARRVQPKLERALAVKKQGRAASA